MSIKPKFGMDILRGVKKIELRGFVADIAPGDLVVLYLSSPVKAICGEFRVGRIVFGLEEVKRFVHGYGDAGVGDEDWLYLIGRKKPMAIEVLNPIEYSVKVTLDDLRRLIPDFKPPLSYRIVRPDERLYGLIRGIRRLSGLL